MLNLSTIIRISAHVIELSSVKRVVALCCDILARPRLRAFANNSTKHTHETFLR